jgi:hypothetical protein
MHCWIYMPAFVGNFVKPPLIVAPAGSRFVSGALDQANVSAFACGVKASEEIAMASAAITERVFIIILFIVESY